PVPPTSPAAQASCSQTARACVPMPSGARPLPYRARRRAKKRASSCAASPRLPIRPRSKVGGNYPTIASSSPCAGSRARTERGSPMRFWPMRFWRGVAILLLGGVLGTGFGVALGFFFFPFVFPPPPSADVLTEADRSALVATGTFSPAHL